jgi:hypothetical protein
MTEMICCKIRGVMAWSWRRAQSGPRGRCRVEKEGSRNSCSTTDASTQDVDNVKIYGSRAGRGFRDRTRAFDGSYMNPGSRPDLEAVLPSQDLSAPRPRLLQSVFGSCINISQTNYPIEHPHTKTNDY